MSTFQGNISRGLASARPAAAAAVVGALYYSTDTGVIERNTGAAWESYGGTGPLLLATKTAAVSATLDFTSVITSAFDDYLIEILSVLPATNAANLQMLLSTDNGSSWTGGTTYRYATSYASDIGATGHTESNGAAAWFLAGTIANSTDGVSGTVRLHNPLSATLTKQMHGQLSFLHSDTNRYRFDFAGWYVSVTAANAIRFQMSSGNITSGIIRLYGMPK